MDRKLFVNFSELFLTKVQETIRSLFLYECATTFITTIKLCGKVTQKFEAKKHFFLALTASNTQKSYK